MTTPLIGVSKSILKIKKLINRLANTGLTILITGETGVGKEVVAQNLYSESSRSSKNFVKINCSALPENLLESELYGYEKGAFTDAHKKRSGKFQTADKGVLFLDEIGDMPLSMQTKILHALESGEFSPLGSDHVSKTDVWVISATSNNLEEKISNKTFREDLFYRLNTIKIDIQPLRERKEDIPCLIDYYFKLYKSEYPQSLAVKPDSDTLSRLCNYPWPGNVRQLENCIKKQMVLNSWEKIFDDFPKEHLKIIPPPNTDGIDHETRSGANNKFSSHRAKIISEFLDFPTSSDKFFTDISLKKIKKLASDKVEKEVIVFVLNKVEWNRTRAAKILKICYPSLLNKMDEFEVQPPIQLNSLIMRDKRAER